METLEVIAGLLRGQQFHLEDYNPPIVLGRGHVDLILGDPQISRSHAELAHRMNQWMVTDLDSSNGTFVNEMRIHQPTPLKHGDQLRLGKTILVFRDKDKFPDPAAEPKQQELPTGGMDETILGTPAIGG